MSHAEAGTAINVHRYGTPGAPRLVLLHGLTDDGTNWPDLVARYAGRWDILAPDLRGHGGSPRFTEAELGTTPDVMLADVVGLLEAQPEPVVLIGHSLGGVLALRAALARPDRVAALVLEDPAKPGQARPNAELVASNEAFLDSMAGPLQRANQIARMRRDTAWSVAELEAWAASKPLVDRRYIHEGLTLGDGPWEELFNALRVPTLLVLPPDAPMAPREDAVDNPLVRRVVVPGSGHCVRRDQPAAYHAALEEFLADVVG